VTHVIRTRVEHVFWIKTESVEDKVELQFEHAEWRPVIMNPVREAYADQADALSEAARAGGATHFV